MASGPGDDALKPEVILATIKQSGAKRTPARAVAVAQALMVGASKRAAAAHAGIDDNTLHRWIHDDPAFRALVEQAEGAAEMTYVSAVYRAASTDPKTAMWWLERRRPKEYGRRDRMDISYETQQLARSIAEEQGLDETELLLEAQAIVESARDRNRRADGA